MKRGKGKKVVTLKDIAKETGYSVNTVSRALRDKDDIAPETKARISKTAEKMGHVRNALALSLRVGYTNTIAVIFGDVSNPHFGVMMKEIEGHARESGYSSFLINTNEDEDLELAAIKSAINRSVDGIIICPTQKGNDNIEYLKKSGIPFVLIGRRFEDVETDYVVCNDELGGYQATKELFEKGHRKILMLHGPTYISSARERLAGYRKVFKENEQKVDENLICEIPITGKDDMERLCDKVIQEKDFTAIFAFSDFLAFAVWDCLKRRGIKVPEECSIVGFDHIQSRLPLPFELTSISSYKGDMATAAVELLIHRINENIVDFQQVVIDTTLLRGDTVCNIN